MKDEITGLPVFPGTGSPGINPVATTTGVPLFLKNLMTESITDIQSLRLYAGIHSVRFGVIVPGRRPVRKDRDPHVGLVREDREPHVGLVREDREPRTSGPSQPIPFRKDLEPPQPPTKHGARRFPMLYSPSSSFRISS